MRSIRTKHMLLIVCAIVVALGIATLIGALSIKDLGKKDTDKMLDMMCTTGALNLESYFDDVEDSVETVAALVQHSLEDMPLEQLESQVERSRNLFEKVANNTDGVLTYYFRIDPEISKNEKGFWYVNLDGEGFKEHEVTDISQYDTNDTSEIVWFTVPKTTGKGVWLPPYLTENLEARVISYNVPVYWNEQFVGVIGIEIDYEALADEVKNIRLFDDGYAFVLGADSKVIYHPEIDATQIYEQETAQTPDGLWSDKSPVSYTFEGVEKEAVWRQLSNGMRLYVAVPASEINRGWQDMLWKCLIASLILLVIVIIISLRFTRRLTKPLQELTEAAKQVDRGNYELVVDYDKDDELGVLTNTFKQLISNTKEHIASLNKQVFIDALTSVRNKGGYDYYVREMQDQMDEQAEKMEFAIGVFDCDNLKAINDSYGHDKGDMYLKNACNLICSVFQHSPVFRIGGDEFSVILQNDDYYRRDELFGQFRKKEADLYDNSSDPWEQVEITFGLAIYDHQTDTSVTDVARRADQMMYENKRIRKEGLNMPSAEELARGINTAKYVVENIDRAIEHKWIKVYYQPVIRSLTGALCGVESLTRWDDPEIGFLMPKQFIRPLEKSHQIYKVDCFAVEQVCADIHERILLGKPVVPVSINFSRLDFTICNMLDVVEQAVARYDVPREYIHIEVTESMIASDEALMRRVIDDFKKTGYEVWMDDFGSGYSSLTLLKDYNFDLLKMDMNFLTSLSERSKKVLQSVVLMAKELGIKTLAEGVETKEEMAFLKEIGCGKMQGYYFGKPQPIEEMFAHLEEIQVQAETREQGRFYEKACEYIKPTDAPLEIVEDDGVRFKTLFMNKAYKEQIFNDNPDLIEADRRIYETPSPLLRKYREFADKIEKSGEEETFYYTGANSYLRFQAQAISEYEGRYLLKGSLINLSMDQEREKIEELDIRLRELNQMFEVVSVIDLNKNRFTPLLGDNKFFSDYGSDELGLQDKLDIIAKKRMHPDEKEKFTTFADFSTIVERVRESEHGYISSIFHILHKDGYYKPEEIVLMPISGSGSKEFLFCVKMYCEM